MKVRGFDELADLALRKSGHAFRANQTYLLEARLGPIMRRESFSELGELADCLKARPNPILEQEIVAAMLGKDTRFFGNRKTLRTIITELLPAIANDREEAGGKAPLRVWCAGGGAGQEAYSLAILLDEMPEDAMIDQKVEIVSTDICKQSTDKAVLGIYDHYEIQLGLSAKRMLKYFSKKDNDWQANSTLRERVEFNVQNLMEPFDEFERFDIILCRNVLGGILTPIATDITRRLGPVLNEGGALFLGENEVLPVDTGFQLSTHIEGAWHYDPKLRDTAAVA